jgi:hypothetical protein
MSNYNETIQVALEGAVNPAERTCAAYGDHAYGNPLTDLSKRIQRRLDVSFSSAGGGFMNERSSRTTSKDVTQVKVIGGAGRDYKLEGRFYLAT